MLLVSAVVEERLQALGGADPEVVRALGTDVEAGLEVLVVDQLGAAGTLDPEALGDSAGFFGRGRRDWLPGLLEPGHASGALNEFKMQKLKMRSRQKPGSAFLHFAPPHLRTSDVTTSAARSTACPGPCR